MKLPKKEKKVEEKTVFILSCDGKFALRKRPNIGLLAGLWEFPNADGALTEEDASKLVRTWKLEPKQWKNKLTAKHIFTHVEWHMTGYTLEISGEGPDDLVWMDARALREHAVPSAVARYYAEAGEELKEF